jgi:cation diffusion facilitator CzcD-associated flavoprotein CzcO
VEKSLEAEVVISATGLLNKWKWPTIEGLHEFQGKLLHSANWDTSW